MGMTLKRSRKSSVIRLEGEVDIAAAAELRKLLLEACGSGREVRVVLRGVTDLDVTAVQLIWAARRAAEEAGVAFKLSGALPQSVSTALDHAGLEGFLVTLDVR